VGLEVVAEPRGTRAELSRRAGGRELLSEEMLIAYGELEREMNELRNNIGRKANTGDIEMLNAWKELGEIKRAEAFCDLETRAVRLAEAAERGRERRYGGVRVIEVTSIRETSANANATDAPEGRSSTVAHKNAGGEPEQAEKPQVRIKSIKKEKKCDTIKIKLEKRTKTEAKENDAEAQTKDKKKSKMKLRKASTSTESSEEEDEAPLKRTTHTKDKKEKKKSKTRSSDTGEDEKNLGKNAKDKTRKDKNKTMKRRQLEFLTDESSEDECCKRTRRHKAEKEEKITSSTSSEEDSISDASTRKSTGKNRSITGKHFKKWLVLEKFDGTTPLCIFLNQLDTCAKYNGWDLEDKASHLRVSLKGNAAYIINNENLKGAPCHRLIKRLKSRFGTEGQSSLYGCQLRTRRRGKYETLQTLYHDINRMSGLAYLGKSSINRELASIDVFIDASNDSNLRMRIRDKELKNLDHALHIALLAEANTEAKLNAAQDDPTTRGKEYKARGVQNTNSSNNGASNISIDSINNRCDKYVRC